MYSIVHGLNRSRLYVRSLTHAPELAPEILAVGLNVRRQSVTLEFVHRHEKLAPESGVKFMAPISGAGFWSICWALKLY